MRVVDGLAYRTVPSAVSRLTASQLFCRRAWKRLSLCRSNSSGVGSSTAAAPLQGTREGRGGHGEINEYVGLGKFLGSCSARPCGRRPRASRVTLGGAVITPSSCPA